MTRSLLNRIAKLEASKEAQSGKVVGVIGSRFGHMIVDPQNPGHLKWAEPPGGFAAFALKQQNELQDELSRLFADTEPRQEKHNPNSVGKDLAPLKPGQKRARYIEVDGAEIDTFSLNRT